MSFARCVKRQPISNCAEEDREHLNVYIPKVRTKEYEEQVVGASSDGESQMGWIWVAVKRIPLLDY